MLAAPVVLERRDELILHRLRCYSRAKTILNVVVHGPPGAGKRTLVARHLAEASVGGGADATRVRVRPDGAFETDAHVEWTPSGKVDDDTTWFKDELATLEGSLARKTMVIVHAERLTTAHQMAMRVDIERNRRWWRFFFVTSQSSALVAAIRSRCLSVRVPAPSDAEVDEVVRRVWESVRPAEPPIDGMPIAEQAGGNLRVATMLTLRRASIPTHADVEELRPAITADVVLNQFAQRPKEMFRRLAELGNSMLVTGDSLTGVQKVFADVAVAYPACYALVTPLCQPAASWDAVVARCCETALKAGVSSSRA